MARTNYTSAQNAAFRLIDQAGQTIPFARVVSGTYDPATGATTETIETASVVGVPLPVSANMTPGFSDEFKQNLQIGKARFLYVAAKDLTLGIESGDFLQLDGKVWEVVGSTPLDPGGLKIMFSVGVTISGRANMPA